MKNKTSFEKGKARPDLDIPPGKHMRGSSPQRGFQKKKRLLHYKLGCGGETFFKGWEHLDEYEKKPLSGVGSHFRSHLPREKSGLYSRIRPIEPPAAKSFKKLATDVLMPGLRGQEGRMVTKSFERSIPGKAWTFDGKEGVDIKLDANRRKEWFCGKDLKEATLCLTMQEKPSIFQNQVSKRPS